MWCHYAAQIAPGQFREFRSDDGTPLTATVVEALRALNFGFIPPPPPIPHAHPVWRKSHPIFGLLHSEQVPPAHWCFLSLLRRVPHRFQGESTLLRHAGFQNFARIQSPQAIPPNPSTPASESPRRMAMVCGPAAMRPATAKPTAPMHCGATRLPRNHAETAGAGKRSTRECETFPKQATKLLLKHQDFSPTTPRRQGPRTPAKATAATASVFHLPARRIPSQTSLHPAGMLKAHPPRPPATGMAK